jgi:DASH complex subunit DAD3
MAAAPHTDAASSAPTSQQNPYLGHRHLSAQQAQLLGEYYRLSQTLKRILALSGALSATKPHAQVLDLLRLTERKMGLVITLFKASVWSIMVEQEERNRALEEAGRVLDQEEEERQRMEMSVESDRTVVYDQQQRAGY